MHHREEAGHYLLDSVEPGEVVGVGLRSIAPGLTYAKVMVGAKDESNAMSSSGIVVFKNRPKGYHEVFLNVSLF